MEPPKKLITKILESAFMFALACFLVNTGIQWLVEVWQVLAVIAIIIVVFTIGWRIWKHKKHDLGEW